MDNETKTVPGPSVSSDEIQPSLTDEERISDFRPDVQKKNPFEINLMLNPEFGYLKTYSMRALYEHRHESDPPIIEGLLYPGLYLFAGAPKIGKSFCMLQLAYQVSRGGKLWNFEIPRPRSVLYAALEDTKERLQDSMYRMFWTDLSENLFLSFETKTVEGGLINQLNVFLGEHKDTGLIILDTLQKVRETGSGSYCYAMDYENIGKLKAVADAHKLCIIVVHHTRKMDASDRTEMISGTTGLLGAADGAFIMYKEKRTDLTASLEITGRDQGDQKLYLTRNEETLAFELDRVENDYPPPPPDQILQKIGGMIGEGRPVWVGRATALVQLLDLPIKGNTLSYHLNVKAGQLWDRYRIRFETGRTHEGRSIKLSYEPPVTIGSRKTPNRDDDDGSDDDFDTP